MRNIMLNLDQIHLTDQPLEVEKLLSQEKPPSRSQYFSHQFDNYSLEAQITYNEANDWPAVLSLHGARSDYTTNRRVIFSLQKAGISVLAFNFSGHNQMSPLSLAQTSLGQNIEESRAFYNYLAPRKAKTLIGYSMGAAATLELLRSNLDEIEKVILFYPALYAKKAYDQPFGEPFKQVISQPYSYFDNDLIDSLAEFRGKILIIKGEYDGVQSEEPGQSMGKYERDGKMYYSPIPKDVFDLLMADDKLTKSSRRLIEVPKCDHSIIRWLEANPQSGKQLLQSMGDFLSE